MLVQPILQYGGRFAGRFCTRAHYRVHWPEVSIKRVSVNKVYARQRRYIVLLN